MEPLALLVLALGTLSVITAVPTPPVLSPLLLPVPSSVGTGTPFDVTCVTNVTVDNVTITANDQPFPVSLSGDGHRATATVTVTRPGRVRLGCAVRAGESEAGVTINIYAYDVPEPILNVTTTRPAAGTVLRGQCSLPAGALRDIRVRVVAGGDNVLVDGGQPPVTFELPVREEKEEMELLCQARLESIVRSSSVSIHVLVKPHLDTLTCPTHQNWTEGQEETLNCRAGGRPRPQIVCSKGQESLDTESSQRAHRDHAGVYRCRATNELGTAERNVTIWVIYDNSIPVLPLVLGTVFPALTLLILAGFYLLYRHNTKIGIYWLWKR
ncbi:hypothetical protein HGM15179_020220 [Zosterops borbonicus]|uniref:Ig-like domain-containing protein n=1 Tax=Zosterops borbonicus TaxID=364589 RepID=A0A8K1D857_9PASS|nr:hypothetical protein HGM15179_020220 [Zosterops borbonicus]